MIDDIVEGKREKRKRPQRSREEADRKAGGHFSDDDYHREKEHLIKEMFGAIRDRSREQIVLQVFLGEVLSICEANEALGGILNLLSYCFT